MTYGFTIFYVGSACLLCCVLGRPPRAGFAMRELAKIGFYSYSIYLWHMPVKVWLTPILVRILGLSRDYLVESSLYLVLSLLVGILMARLVELPVLALRDRWIPSMTSSPRTTAEPRMRDATSVPVPQLTAALVGQGAAE
jgi:peptidoglycan/LPS O-acetylase OafA/YrhL